MHSGCSPSYSICSDQSSWCLLSLSVLRIYLYDQVSQWLSHWDVGTTKIFEESQEVYSKSVCHYNYIHRNSSKILNLQKQLRPRCPSHPVVHFDRSTIKLRLVRKTCCNTHTQTHLKDHFFRIHGWKCAIKSQTSGMSSGGGVAVL